MCVFVGACTRTRLSACSTRDTGERDKGRWGKIGKWKQLGSRAKGIRYSVYFRERGFRRNIRKHSWSKVKMSTTDKV